MCFFNSFPPYFHSSIGKLSNPQLFLFFASFSTLFSSSIVILSSLFYIIIFIIYIYIIIFIIYLYYYIYYILYYYIYYIVLYYYIYYMLYILYICMYTCIVRLPSLDHSNGWTTSVFQILLTGAFRVAGVATPDLSFFSRFEFGT